MTLLLRDSPGVIERYKDYHRHAWPEIVASLRQIGVVEMKIYLLGRRLFMYMEAVDGFDPDRDFPKLDEDAQYQKWDALMRGFQERVPEAKEGEWWASMEEVFDLSSQ